MKRWLEFLKERLPLPVLLISSLGLSGSSQALSPYPLSALTVGLGALLAFVFFLTMRIMDEVKDFKKDQIAHPERPLPRGLLSLDEAKKAVTTCLALAVTGGLGVGLLGFQLAAGLYLFSCFYLFLMYKEFFIADWLETRVMLYTFTHQIVMLFLSAALTTLVYPGLEVSFEILRPGLLFLGIFFTFEIARKLDPAAHPMLQTYRVLYGARKTGALLTLGCILDLLGIGLNRSALGLGAYLLAAGPVLILLLFPRFMDKNHKAIEGLAGLWMLLFVWTPFVVRLIG